MNKNFVSLLLLLISINCFSQTHYEKGYFIDNQNIKTDCFIRNSGWLNNPTSFKYKITEKEQVKTAEMENVKEFCIPNRCKFIRANVDIDMSPSVLKNLSTEKNPLWQHKQLFLKVLVEGEAKLFYYLDNGIDERFFYSCKDSVIRQLVYKEYIPVMDHTAFNDSFRIQLRNSVRCSFASDIALSDLAYKKDDLEKYFIGYNTCVDPSYTVPVKKRYTGELNLSLSAGLAYSSISISNFSRNYINTNFDRKLINVFSLGVEYILPVNNYKWGIVLNTDYQSYNSKIMDDTKMVTIDFASVDLALGLKHYLYINNNAKLFFDCYINSIINYSFDSKIGYKVSTTKDLSYLNMTETYNTNFIFGVGFEYKRIMAELRYYTPQNVLSRFSSWDSEFEKISLNIGYKILKTKHNH